MMIHDSDLLSWTILYILR